MMLNEILLFFTIWGFVYHKLQDTQSVVEHSKGLTQSKKDKNQWHIQNSTTTVYDCVTCHLFITITLLAFAMYCAIQLLLFFQKYFWIDCNEQQLNDSIACSQCCIDIEILYGVQKQR